MSKRHAFTLIELLIVVAIIAILAAIAVPNFLEAQTRAKVSRVQSDLRTIATALETYAVDNNKYPPTPIALGPRFRNFRPLTTPVAYMTDIPTDPFKSIDPHGHGRWHTSMYDYGATPVDAPVHWVLASDGPDRNDDCNPLMFYPGYTPGLFVGLDPNFDYMVYDPTNGTVSRGDIVRANDYMLER